jgi:hypothetical protein
VTDDAVAGEAPYDADATTRAGVYANALEVVLHPSGEAVLDFVRREWDAGSGLVVARVVLGPEGFHRLLDMAAKLPGLWGNHTGRVT